MIEIIAFIVKAHILSRIHNLILLRNVIFIGNEILLMRWQSYLRFEKGEK